MKLLLGVLLMIGGTNAQAQTSSDPSWLRNSAISPNGKEICFTYKGDIFTISNDGGNAKQLTTNPAYDTAPFWSPDGSKIMFSSDRLGSTDIYVIDSKGGAATRLTTHSGKEIPVGFKNNNTILFQASMMPAINSSQFPSSIFSQIYEIPVTGGRPEIFSSMPIESVTITDDGSKIFFHDKKGYEDTFRKHHKSSISRDIWSADIVDNKIVNYKKLSAFYGEDRNPVQGSDKNTLYYVSEQDGTMNIYKMDIDSKKSTQITSYKNHPVRSLSISENDMLCYSWNGNIYTLNVATAGAKPIKLNAQITTDVVEIEEVKRVLSTGAGQMDLSPNGKEIAFIIRGDIFVTSVDYKTTKQITNSANQERNVSFSPDGRSLVYASERDGLWQIYQTSIVRKADKSFTYAIDLKEERITNSKIVSFQPQYSPNGEEIAFLEDRTELRVINLKSKKVRTLMDKKFEYSYKDGDQAYTWSPDSKWILSSYIGIGGWNNKDIVIINADGSQEIHNLTESGYTDSNASWVLDGNAMMWFNDREGYRSHGSWGAHSDAYIMFFNLEAYEKFRMNKEELAFLTDQKKDIEKVDEDKAKDDKNAETKEEKKEVKALQFDLVNAKDRVIRITGNSSSIADAVLTKDGSKLYYLTVFEKGYDLWVNDLQDKSIKRLQKSVGAGELYASKDGKNIFMSTGGNIKKIDIVTNKVTPIQFEAEFTLRSKAEREYMFNHVWQQVKDKFYVENIHNVDWELYRNNYEPMLEHINNNYDFSELLSEMLGELNGSHTGARYSHRNTALQTASLGIFVDEQHKGDGLKISEIITGSPLNVIKSNVQNGDVITMINGVKITKGMDYFPLLEGKADKKVVLTINKPNSKESFEQIIKPITTRLLNNLLYKRWVNINSEMVDSLSGGKVGYVHIKGMDSNSFRQLYSDVLGKHRNKQTLVVDTRHNGGGWLHDDVITLLSGKKYQRFIGHGQFIGNDPFNKWLKPSTMLMCEDNYSNAHGTPWLYKELEVGKLIGSPVPGTMTAVWWETLIDPSIVFGIPQLGCVDNDGNYAENIELQPDILIYNTIEDVVKGKDKQLEKAVEHMLEVGKSNK